MIGRFAIAALACAALGACAAPFPPALRAEVRARNDALEAAFRDGDTAQVAAIYADDAVLLGPGGTRHEGREAVDRYWARFDRPIDWRLTVDELEGDDSLLVQRGTSVLVYVGDGGEVRTSEVEFIVIWTRDDAGRLRIAVDAYW